MRKRKVIKWEENEEILKDVGFELRMKLIKKWDEMESEKVDELYKSELGVEMKE